MELNSYEINNDTLVLIPFGKGKTKVYEGDKEFVIKKSSLRIIEDSCLFFGSSYEGRKSGTKSLLGIDMKVPIVIEDVRNTIFFPVSSCVRENSIWISYQNLLKYSKFNDLVTILYFKNHVNIRIGCKFCLFDNQFIRCMKLEKILLNRKKFIEKEPFIFDNF